MKRTFNHLKGFSILEQAIAIPVIVFFALGAVDITNYFKAKSALQEGVKKTLRCLTPLDGECNVYTPPQTVPAYNIYTSSVTPTWPDKIYDFNGTAQWASAVEKVLIPEATILKDVTYPLKNILERLIIRRILIVRIIQ